MAEDKVPSSVSEGVKACRSQYDSSFTDSDLCAQCSFKCIQGACERPELSSGLYYFRKYKFFNRKDNRANIWRHK